ncbi:MAG: hypothetical protein AVDCRST_MAG01-01-4385, partial [uncultured Rubrobacteraceae bacterium]
GSPIPDANLVASRACPAPGRERFFLPSPLHHRGGMAGDV